MLFAKYGRKLSAHKKATLGVGVILSQSYCYGYHDYDLIYIGNFFAIKYYLVHILAKHWAFIAYMKHISALQTFGHSHLKQILPRGLQYFSLYITLKSFFCKSIYM